MLLTENEHKKAQIPADVFDEVLKTSYVFNNCLFDGVTLKVGYNIVSVCLTAHAACKYKSVYYRRVW